MARLAALALTATLVLAPATAGADRFLDAVLGGVEGQAITASDVALARALGLFGLSPSAAPITVSDLERFVGIRMVLVEAQRLDIAPDEGEVEQAWRAAAARLGGDAALGAWLARAGVERAWARAAVADDARWRRFVRLRFRVFVFVPESDVLAALGAGRHDAAARARMRDVLETRETDRRLGQWLREAARRAVAQRALRAGAALPCPLPMPMAGAQPDTVSGRSRP